MTNLYLIGNWKQNGSHASIADFSSQWSFGQNSRLHIAIAPPFPYLQALGEALPECELAAQDCSVHANGAYTGEVSAEMLIDVGAELVLVGHSERRQDNNETNKIIKQKAEAVQRAGATAVVCIGETLEERKADRTLQILQEQMLNCLPKNVNPKNTVVAYEPVWAIGTGLVPEIDQIRSAHSFIRGFLASTFGAEAHNVKILYGGSVKGSNAREIFSISNVNGALVGGASLKSSDFIEIIKAAS